MREKKAVNLKDKKVTTRVVSRKRSYRSVQYSLVVASFAVSFMGAAWLQAQDKSVDSDMLAVSAQSISEVGEVPASAFSALDESTVALPTAQPGPTQASTPSATVPLVPEATPPTQQVAPSTRSTRLPRAVARSRSSR